MGTGQRIIDFIEFPYGGRKREVPRTRLAFLQTQETLPADEKGREGKHKGTEESCVVGLRTLKKKDSGGENSDGYSSNINIFPYRIKGL